MRRLQISILVFGIFLSLNLQGYSRFPSSNPSDETSGDFHYRTQISGSFENEDLILQARKTETMELVWENKRKWRSDQYQIRSFSNIVGVDSETYLTLEECDDAEPQQDCGTYRTSLLRLNSNGKETLKLPLPAKALGFNQVRVDRLMRISAEEFLIFSAGRKDHATVPYGRTLIVFSYNVRTGCLESHNLKSEFEKLSLVKVIRTPKGYIAFTWLMDAIYLSPDLQIEHVIMGFKNPSNMMGYFLDTGSIKLDSQGNITAIMTVSGPNNEMVIRKFSTDGNVLFETRSPLGKSFLHVTAWDEGDACMEFIGQKVFKTQPGREYIKFSLNKVGELKKEIELPADIEGISQLLFHNKRVFGVTYSGSLLHQKAVELDPKTFHVIRSFAPANSQQGFYRLDLELNVLATVPTDFVKNDPRSRWGSWIEPELKDSFWFFYYDNED